MKNNKDLAKKEVAQLVEKYKKVLDSNAVKQYKEERTKIEFILPLFRALGWTHSSLSEEGEIIPEEKASNGRVDFSFNINHIPVFLLEVKSLKTNLNDWKYAEQTINYSWSRGVTWAILTDFEGIKIFSAEIPPRSLRENLFFELKWNQYIDQFDKLWLLSKESFEGDLIYEKAKEWGKVQEKISLDERLFADLVEWRNLLTKNFDAWDDKNEIDNETLDEGVQRIINRLIFIRTAEDRKIIPPILLSVIRNWEKNYRKNDLYQNLVKVFRDFEHNFDSKLFEEHSCEKWKMTDGSPFKEIIESMYATDEGYKYDFSAIPSDVMGQVYEKYLGYTTIIKANSKKEKITERRIKRKSQGIYYTPKYIVDYIVRNTLGEFLKHKSFNDIRDIKTLDPACGSGSFLINAYDELLKYYQLQYNKDDFATKTQILTSNIFGVDLDTQAAEITQLNLLLKALDSKNILPDLSRENIKAGNSLISGEEKELKKYFGKKWKEKKPFNWKEKFPEVFKQGGFDIIIGNPPYIFARGGNFDVGEKAYFSDHYDLQQYQLNTFLLFIERGLNFLKNDGYFGFIIPNNWLTINSFSKIREFLLKNTSDLKIINITDTVFNQASVDTCLLIFQKAKPTKIELGEFRNGTLSFINRYKPEDLFENNFLINIAKSKNDKNEKLKFENVVPLELVATVSTGLKAYQIGKGKPLQTKEIKDGRKFHSKEKTNNTFIPYLSGSDVKRYKLDWSGEYLSYGDWLAEPRKSVPFNGKRILVRQIPSPYPECINAVFVNSDYLNDINSMVIFNPSSKYDLRYILGVINSQLISYWFVNYFDKFQRKIFPQFKVNELGQFPIHKTGKGEQRIIIELVDRILKLNKDLQKASKNSNKWNSIKEEIEKTDKKINQEVYKLYGLTSEEIKIVEDMNEKNKS